MGIQTQAEDLAEEIADAMSSIDNVPLFLADYSEIYDVMLKVQDFLLITVADRDF